MKQAARIKINDKVLYSICLDKYSNIQAYDFATFVQFTLTPCAQVNMSSITSRTRMVVPMAFLKTVAPTPPGTVRGRVAALQLGNGSLLPPVG